MGLNHKMGQRALPNSYWSMEDNCVGYLVGGAKHAGLMQMFTMMRGRRPGLRVAAGRLLRIHGVEEASVASTPPR